MSVAGHSTLRILKINESFNLMGAQNRRNIRFIGKGEERVWKAKQRHTKCLGCRVSSLKSSPSCSGAERQCDVDKITHLKMRLPSLHLASAMSSSNVDPRQCRTLSQVSIDHISHLDC